MQHRVNGQRSSRARVLSGSLIYGLLVLAPTPLTAQSLALGYYGAGQLPVTEADVRSAVGQLPQDVREAYLSNTTQVQALVKRIALARERQAVEAGLSSDQLAQIALEAELARHNFAQKLQSEAIAKRILSDANSKRQQRVRELYVLDNASCLAPATYLASHILIRTDNKPLEEAIAKLETLKASLAKGMDFGEVARQYSEDDTSAKNGGVLPPFSRKDVDKLFAKEYFRDMAKGRVSQPFQTRFGFHVLRVDGPASAERKMPIDDCKIQLEKLVDTELQNNALRDFDAAVTKAANLTLDAGAIERYTKSMAELPGAKSASAIEKALQLVESQKATAGQPTQSPR